jgi:hypothetical protein
VKAKLLHKAGSIKAGATVEVGAKVGENRRPGPEDYGAPSATSAPVYAVTDKAGHAEKVDTRDFKIVR